MLPSANQILNHDVGTKEIHGIAKGSSSMPDSPESAGFFEAMKNIQANTAAAADRNSPAAIAPPREDLNTSDIALKPVG